MTAISPHTHRAFLQYMLVKGVSSNGTHRVSGGLCLHDFTTSQRPDLQTPSHWASALKWEHANTQAVAVLEVIVLAETECKRQKVTNSQETVRSLWLWEGAVFPRRRWVSPGKKVQESLGKKQEPPGKHKLF